MLQANLVSKITLHPYCNRSIGPCLLGANAFLYDPVSIYIIIYILIYYCGPQIHIYIYLYTHIQHIYIYILLLLLLLYIYIQTHVRCLDPYDADMQTWAQITGKNELIERIWNGRYWLAEGQAHQVRNIGEEIVHQEVIKRCRSPESRPIGSNHLGKQHVSRLIGLGAL